MVSDNIINSFNNMNDDKVKNEIGIPENAFRELEKGEEYVPVMHPDKQYKEVTPY